MGIGSGTAVIEAPDVLIIGRPGVYSLLRFSGTALAQMAFATRSGDGTPPTGGVTATARQTVFQNASGQFVAACRFAGATAATQTLVVGPSDSNWHAWAIRMLATGGSCTKDGVEVSPTFTSSDVSNTVASAQLGQGDPSSSGGDWACTIIVELGVDPVPVNQAVRDYIRQRFGMAA
jgi:hypothetical protein